MGIARWFDWGAWETDKLRKQQLRLHNDQQAALRQAAYQQGFNEGWRLGWLRGQADANDGQAGRRAQ